MRERRGHVVLRERVVVRVVRNEAALRTCRNPAGRFPGETETRVLPGLISCGSSTSVSSRSPALRTIANAPLHRLARRPSRRSALLTTTRSFERLVAADIGRQRDRSPPTRRSADRAAPASRRCSRPHRQSPGLPPAHRRRSGCRRSPARSAWPRRAGTSPSPAASRSDRFVNSRSSRLSTLRHELNVEIDRRHLDFGILAEHDDAGPVALLRLPLLADRRVHVADHRRRGGLPECSATDRADR